MAPKDYDEDTLQDSMNPSRSRVHEDVRDYFTLLFGQTSDKVVRLIPGIRGSSLRLRSFSV